MENKKTMGPVVLNCIPVKPNLLTKLKNRLAAVLVRNPVALGHQVWCKLNQDLTAPVGALKNDAPRVKIFAQKAQNLSFTAYYSLKKWLECEYKRLEDEFPELHTCSEEQRYLIQRQIYRQHLDALN